MLRNASILSLFFFELERERGRGEREGEKRKHQCALPMHSLVESFTCPDPDPTATLAYWWIGTMF